MAEEEKGMQTVFTTEWDIERLTIDRRPQRPDLHFYSELLQHLSIVIWQGACL